MKCDRSLQSIQPLFTQHFALTRNNTLLLQTCSSAIISGCTIPKFESEGCHNNISCFTPLQTSGSEIVMFKEVNQTKCKVLFSAIAIEQSNNGLPASLQLQVLELGWWLTGQCSCSDKALCINVHLTHGNLGYRCQCAQGYHGDGFPNGSGCQRGQSSNIIKIATFGYAKLLIPLSVLQSCHQMSIALLQHSFLAHAELQLLLLLEVKLHFFYLITSCFVNTSILSSREYGYKQPKD